MRAEHHVWLDQFLSYCRVVLLEVDLVRSFAQNLSYRLVSGVNATSAVRPYFEVELASHSLSSEGLMS